jgi:ferritin-like metal-binding protein YciE
MIGMVDEQLVDAVILGGVVKTEHLEIAMYEGLITKAEAMGADDVVALLQENLEQEQRTLELAEKQAQQVSQKLASPTA